MLKRNILTVPICLGLVAVLGLLGVVAQPVRRSPTVSDLNNRVPEAGAPVGSGLDVTHQVVLQPVPGSEGVLEDTVLIALEPDTRKGGDGALNVRPTSGLERHTLLKWNLAGQLPAGSTIVGAELSLFCNDRTRDWDLTIEAYPMLTDWDEATATWNEASDGVAWDTPGCGAGTDRSAVPAASTTTLGTTPVPAWISWDVTSLAQAWFDYPQDNFGLLLVGSGGSVRYDFMSAEHGATNSRPMLTIEYQEGPISPTPTLTPELTYTPSLTPTPSKTATPTDLPPSWLDISNAIPAYCGPGVTFSGNTSGKENSVTYYGEHSFPYTGPEDVYVLTKSVTSDLTVRLEWCEIGDDLDVLLLASPDPDSLMGGEGVGWGDGAFTYPNLPPGTYYIVVDGWRNSQGVYVIGIYCDGEPTPTPTRTNTPALSYYPLIMRQLPPTPTATPTSTPTSTPTVTPTFVPYGVAVNCGSDALYTASDGWTYGPDQGYQPGSWGFVDHNGGSDVYDTSKDIYGTVDQALFNTHRYAMEEYVFEVPSGRYEILLHFAEIFQYTDVGDRVFDVTVEDQVVLPAFDMVGRGLKFTAYTHPVEIDVTDGYLNIGFAQRGVYGTAINGIRVRSIGSATGQ